MKVILLAVLVALVFSQAPAGGAPAAGAAPAAPAKTPADVQVIKVINSKELMGLLQGINETTVWVVNFHDNDSEDKFTTFTDSLKNEIATNPLVKDPTYQKLHYKIASVNINNKLFETAINDLGMTSNQYQGTYPIALVMRKRKGLFAWGADLAKAVSERLADVADGKTDPFE